MAEKLSLQEALEKALPVDRDVFLTPEQERRSDDAAIQLAHRLEESNIVMYEELRRKYVQF